MIRYAFSERRIRVKIEEYNTETGIYDPRMRAAARVLERELQSVERDRTEFARILNTSKVSYELALADAKRAQKAKEDLELAISVVRQYKMEDENDNIG